MSDGAFLAGNVLLFGRVLRAAGLDVHHGRLLDAVRSLDWVGIRSRTRCRARRCAACSCIAHDDLARFDEAFDLFFRAHRPPAPGLPLFSLGERPRVIATPAPGSAVRVEIDGVEPGAAAADRAAVGAWSAAGVLAHQGLRRLHRGRARARAGAAARAALVA